MRLKSCWLLNWSWNTKDLTYGMFGDFVRVRSVRNQSHAFVTYNSDIALDSTAKSLTIVSPWPWTTLDCLVKTLDKTSSRLCSPRDGGSVILVWSSEHSSFVDSMCDVTFNSFSTVTEVHQNSTTPRITQAWSSSWLSQQIGKWLSLAPLCKSAYTGSS